MTSSFPWVALKQFLPAKRMAIPRWLGVTPFITLQTLPGNHQIDVVAYLLWRQGRRPSEIGLMFRLSDIPLSFGIAIVAYIGYVAVFFVLPRTATVGDGMAEGPAALQGLLSSQVSLLVGLALVNPIFEEVVVRAYPMIDLEHLTGSRIVAVVVSAGVQGYCHLYQGWRGAVALTAMFIIFSVFFVYSGRAVPIILAHLYFDALGIYLLFRQVRPR